MATVPSASDDGSRCLLLALSHDELGVILDGLADPLEPGVAEALCSTCKGLRIPLVLQAVMWRLAREHVRAQRLCIQFDLAEPDELRDKTMAIRLGLDYNDNPQIVTSSDIATLGMILRHGLPKLQHLTLCDIEFGDPGMQSLCSGLTCGSAPELKQLDIDNNGFGLVGAESLAAALSRGALRKLEELHIGGNFVGIQGLSALAGPLRKHPKLKELDLQSIAINDEGLAVLLDDAGTDDFKKLEILILCSNELTEKSCATLVRAIKRGALPALKDVPGITSEQIEYNAFAEARPHGGLAILDAAMQAVDEALWDALAARVG